MLSSRSVLQRLKSVFSDRTPITRKALRTMDAQSLLRRSRAMASAVYVGDRSVLCRVLTRYRLFVDARDVGFGVHVMLDGAWETRLTAFMAKRIEPGMRIVDVGANHGYHTVLFAHLTGPQGRVAAIEPHPRTASLLRRSLYANGFDPWTEVHECAAVAHDGVRLALHVPNDELKNANVAPAPATIDPAAMLVSGARLDTLLAHWSRVDFIKIDVEGAEEDCLEGAWSLIEKHRPMIVLEYNAYRSRDPRHLLDQLSALYGQIRVIADDGSLVSVPRDRLEDATNREDWMLFLAA